MPMRFTLNPHPDSPPSAAEVIAVEIDRLTRTGLRLRYMLSGSLPSLHIPERAAPERTDRLWQTTCFELFVKRPGEEAYLEFNFSPSTQWAAYSFTRYREGMADAPDALKPNVRVGVNDDRLTIEAIVENLPEPPWRIGVAAVIAEADGQKSYWALTHPPGKPDFHHPDCFAAELAPPAEPL